MTELSLVTIYIVNYNYGRFLEECLQSVFSQTYKRIEILLIDDGSEDKESQVLLNKYEDDPRIFLIRQENHGLTFSNNVALKNATGKYIMRLDADDYLEKNCVKELVNVLDNNSDYGLVFPDYYEISENGEIISQVCRHDFSKDVELLDSPAHGACTLFRREALELVRFRVDLNLNKSAFSDTFIFTDMQKFGFKILIDSNIVCEHRK